MEDTDRNLCSELLRMRQQLVVDVSFASEQMQINKLKFSQTNERLFSLPEYILI